MATGDRLAALAAELRASLAVLGRVEAYYDGFTARPGAGDKSIENAIILSDVVVNYYTCLETMFLRISQFFENSLDSAQWHRDLLRRMTHAVTGVRNRVLSDESYAALSELLSFRNFKRYYFEFDYDWDRLDLVLRKLAIARPRVISEMNHYVDYLDELAAAARRGGS
jgi:hypothetical protein